MYVAEKSKNQKTFPDSEVRGERSRSSVPISKEDQWVKK